MRRRSAGWSRPGRTTRKAALAEARAFQKSLYEAGLAGISWPEAYGGRRAAPAVLLHLRTGGGPLRGAQRRVRHRAGHVRPDHRAHGTEEQKQRYLRPMLAGEEIWSQVFSEPGAGSDLAALRTRAVRDGDSWVLTGQKVWTSGALVSQYGLVLARTDPTLPRHAGLSMFIVDFDTPGVTIRPLRQMTGHSKFAEIFFDEARVGDGCGWAPRTTAGAAPSPP